MDWKYILSFLFYIWRFCSAYNFQKNNVIDETFIQVNYTIWFPGEDGSLEDKNIMVEIHNNSTFFDVVRLASYMNEEFAFDYEVIPPYNDHYITAINGIRQHKEHYILWIIYKLDSPPDMNNIPSDDLITIGGVDDLRVSNGDNFLFWLKDLSPENVQKPNS